MSSTVSGVEAQKFCHKNEEKPQRLVRSSSLDKIRMFNSYICSQQYYILPAILAWLRTSQSGLQSATEKTIFFFRSLLFNALLYKLFHVQYRIVAANVLALVIKSLQSTYGRIQSVVAFKVLVYTIGLVLLSELSVCFYLFADAGAPLGLVFLIVCWFYINYLHYRTSFFYTESQRIENVKNK